MTLRELMAPVIRGDMYYATRPRRPPAATDPSGVARDMRSDAEAAAWAKRRALPVSWIPEGATVLDVGCGDGKLKLARPDLTVYGHEPNGSAWADAERRGLVPARAMNMSTGTVWPDTLFLMDVVEHMDDPRGDVERWLGRVRTGALVIVECPDFWCPMAQLYGDRFRLLHDPDHVSLFTAESLVRMLRDLGVMIEDVAFPYYGGVYDTAENAARLTCQAHADGLSPAAPGNMVCVRGRKR
jgi:hypothetical protein